MVVHCTTRQIRNRRNLKPNSRMMEVHFIMREMMACSIVPQPSQRMSRPKTSPRLLRSSKNLNLS